MKKMTLTSKILISLISGIIFGLLLFPFKNITFIDHYIIGFFLKLGGSVFINAIKMLVVPLVFISLTVGSSAIGDTKKLGRIGIKTLSFYLFTTAIAITIALVLANIIDPGNGLIIENINRSDTVVNNSKSFVEVLIDIVPSNPISAMAKGNMLQIIFFALLTGMGLTILGDKVNKIKNLFDQSNDLILELVNLIMQFAPIGVFCLIATTFSTLGYQAMIPLFKYIGTTLLALLIHVLITYQGLLYLVAKINPIVFIKKFIPAISVAFSTSSSGATIPINLEILREKFGVSKSTSSFTIPLGASINMDGTSIMQGVAVVFIATAYGIQLDMGDYMMVILTATLASIGTAGVPGAGPIMLSMVLTQVGLPIEGIALIMGVDRIIDMNRTAVNITGDAVCTLIIAKTEGEDISGEVKTKLI
ncbi:MAG: dicarboxylate/amino acid:cation symporter [Psychrilyobacter sp.]|uniref:dicarboxylate/amino acid:cation symporter n=1 Tax=Psychrilyobacter sp. TaxID=2586924 RepID=UPI003C7691C6